MYIAPRLLTIIYIIFVADKISGQSIVDETICSVCTRYSHLLLLYWMQSCTIPAIVTAMLTG